MHCDFMEVVSKFAFTFVFFCLIIVRGRCVLDGCSTSMTFILRKVCLLDLYERNAHVAFILKAHQTTCIDLAY